MYSVYVSTLAKFKLLIEFVKDSLDANALLTNMSCLVAFILVMKLMRPLYSLVMNFIYKMLHNKNVKTSSNRKYNKLDLLSYNCSACSSSSSSSSLFSEKKKSNTKNKKYKIKLNKKKINNTLRKFKLD